MGGPVNNDLLSHKRDDWQYNRKRRDLRKHLPELKLYLDNKRQSGDTNSLNFRVLEDFSHNVSNASVRVPIFMLLRGEEVFRQEVLKKDETNQSLIDAVWRTHSFRGGVIKKFEDTVERFGSVLKKSPFLMEEYIFTRASTKDEYLESAARVIVFFQKNSLKTHFSNSVVEKVKGETHGAKNVSAKRRTDDDLEELPHKPVKLPKIGSERDSRWPEDFTLHPKEAARDGLDVEDAAIFSAAFTI